MSIITYNVPERVLSEYRRINAVAGAKGPSFDELPWPTADRSHFPVGPGTVLQNARLSNGEFVGLWSSSYGPPVDYLRVKNVELVGGKRWLSRPYNWRDENEFEDVTFMGVEEEHGLYPTMIGRGTYEEGEVVPSKARPSLTLRRVRWEYIGSQAFQLTGPRHLYGQQVGTAPNGTNYPMEYADTYGGPIVVEDNFARLACTWGTRPAFAYSFREAKHHVLIDGLVLDNRQYFADGGLLVEGGVSAINPDPTRQLPWFKRHLDARRVIVLQSNAKKPPVQLDHVTTVRAINWAIYQENQRPIRIQRSRSHPGRIVFDQCVGNVRVHIDGEDAGPIQGQRIEVAW